MPGYAKRILLLSLAGLVAGLGTPAHAGPELILDIDPGQTPAYPGDSMPEVFAVVNGKALFTASYTYAWRSLWVTDGTPSGTRILRDVPTGAYTGGIRGAASSGGYAYFCDNYALYRSDGTAAGTIKLRALSYIPPTSGGPGSCIFGHAGGSLLVFRTFESKEVVISDGTVAGTQPHLNVTYPAGYPGYGADITRIFRVAEVGNESWFTARGVTAPLSLFRTDGTSAGTQFVSNLAAAGNIDLLTPFGGKLYFGGSVSSSVAQRTVWVSDGTAPGTANANLGTTGAPTAMAVSGGKLLIVTHDNRLWASDGTAAGTQLLAELAIDPWSFTVAGSGAYFMAHTPSHGSELWKTDGTPAGTVRVTAQPGTTFPVTKLQPLGDGVLLLVSGSGSVKDHVMYSDGTAVGTKVITASSNQAWQLTQMTVGQRGLFVGKDTATGIELYATDGTAAGTVLLRNILGGTTSQSSWPRSLTHFNGKVAFFASHPSYGRELWQTDGTAAGTQVLDLNPGTATGVGTKMVVAGTRLYFDGAKQGSGIGVWEWDGGGQPLFHNRSGGLTFTTNNIGKMMPVGNRVVFAAPRSGNPNQLFLAGDGLPEPVLLLDGYTGDNSSFFHPDRYQATDGAALFLSVTHGNQKGLWRLDGTPNGATQLAPQGWYPTWSGTQLFFAHGNATTGAELCVSDGVTPGCDLLDLVPGPVSSNPRELVEWGGKVYFSAEGPAGRELWVSDGTLAGSQMVKDIHPSGSSNPRHLVAVTGGLLFFADDGTSGLELWRTDGTAQNTARVADLAPGLDDFHVEWVQSVQGVAYFSGNDLLNGVELWRSDGTAAGTWRLTDIAFGPAGAFPTKVALNGSHVIFGATDSAGDIELWKAPVGAVGMPPLASGATVSTEKGTPVALGLTASDPDGDPLTWHLETAPSHGALVGAGFASYTPAAGYVGTDTFTFFVHDGVSPSNLATVDVLITPPQPVVSAPANASEVAGPQVEFTGTAEPGAQVTLDENGAPLASVNASGTGSFSVVVSLPYGARTVAVSQALNGATSAARVVTFTVVDLLAPAISGLPANIILDALSPEGTPVTWDPPAAVDDVDGAVPVTCTPPSGTTFPLGTTTVSCSATDAAGNTGTGSFSVTVVDRVPPVGPATPEDLVVEATSAEGAVVTFGPWEISDVVSPTVETRCTPDSGSTFALGSHTVECTAEDGSGNVTTWSFSVEVVDTTPPAFSGVPESVTASAEPGAESVRVVWSGLLAVDLVDGDVPAQCTPGSGDVFPVGTTAVRCVAADSRANSSEVTFAVVVSAADPDPGSPGDSAAGCGCSADGGSGAAFWASLFALALAAAARRTRRRPRTTAGATT